MSRCRPLAREAHAGGARRPRSPLFGALILLSSGLLLSTPHSHAQERPGALDTSIEGVVPLEVSPTVANLMAEQVARQEAAALGDHLVDDHLRQLVLQLEAAEPTERALLIDHIARAAPPARLLGALRAPAALPSHPPVGKVARLVRFKEGAVSYIAMIPEGYTPDRAWPVHFSLHGGGGSSLKNCRANWQGEPAARGVILVCPRVYRGGWWLPGGEERLLRVWDDLRTQYRVDVDRVSIDGASSGGAGVWHMATRLPWMWSAAVPRCAALPLDPESLGNLKGVRVHIMHGLRDGTILVQNSQTAFALLRARGFDVTYFEDPKVGHHFMYGHNEAVLDRIEGARRADPWGAFSYRAAPHGEALERVHWLKIDWGQSYRPGEVIEGEVALMRQGEGWLAEVRLEISADVARIEALLPPDPRLEGADVAVILNGERVLEGALSASTGAILSSWSGSHDPAMLTPYSVSITLRGDDEGVAGRGASAEAYRQ